MVVLLKRSRRDRDDGSPGRRVIAGIVDFEAEARSGDYEIVADLTAPGGRAWQADGATHIEPMKTKALVTILEAGGSSVSCTKAYPQEDPVYASKEVAKARQAMDVKTGSTWRLIQTTKKKGTRPTSYSFKPAEEATYLIGLQERELRFARPDECSGRGIDLQRDEERDLDFTPCYGTYDPTTEIVWVGHHVKSRSLAEVRVVAPWLQIGEFRFEPAETTTDECKTLERLATAMPREGGTFEYLGEKKYWFCKYTTAGLREYLALLIRNPSTQPVLEAELRWYLRGDGIPEDDCVATRIMLTVRQKSSLLNGRT